MLNVKSDQVLEKIQSLQQELKNSRKENSSLKRQNSIARK